MRRLTAHAWARAGLLGNPSDGYGGKTISLTLRGFFAQAVLEESGSLVIGPDPEDVRTYSNVDALLRQVGSLGYYGSDRLVRAAIVRFAHYARRHADLNAPNFTIQVQSNIPRLVGMAGSSALVIATLRGLMEWYGLTLPPDILASLALSVERDELGIPAGLQDRVVQSYQGLVFMDFSAAETRHRDGFQVGAYERLDASRLPPLFLAYSAETGEPTEVTHRDLRSRFMAKEPAVMTAIHEWAQLAAAGRNAILEGDTAELARLMNRNFDIRRRILKLHPRHIEMVECARRLGASAKFCGSGGAIIGTYGDESQWHSLKSEFERLNCSLARVDLAGPNDKPPAPI